MSYAKSWLSLSVSVLSERRFYSLGRSEHVSERTERISDQHVTTLSGSLITLTAQKA
jgi:hypothetical protein